MITYQLQTDFHGNVNAVLKNNSISIPFDEYNADYQAYLAWLDEGNTPQPADEGVA